MKPKFRDVRDRLRYVGMEQADYDLERFPDFLIIGPLRTGTTWLQECLAEHPQVFIPPWKEVHYFSNLEHPEYHPKDLRPVEPDLGWYLDQFRIPESHSRARDEECRRSYGRPYAPTVFGEATATYAADLHEGLIEEILLLNPDIKIMTMVRDPIERAWSNAKKNLSRERNRPVADVPEAEWLEFIEKKFQIRSGHYSEYHPLWKRLVAPENLMIGRFVDVANDPVGLLTRTYRFLGIDADEQFVTAIAGVRVNPTQPSRMPPVVRERLEELFGDEVRRLREEGLV